MVAARVHYCSWHDGTIVRLRCPSAQWVTARSDCSIRDVGICLQMRPASRRDHQPSTRRTTLARSTWALRQLSRGRRHAVTCRWYRDYAKRVARTANCQSHFPTFTIDRFTTLVCCPIQDCVGAWYWSVLVPFDWSFVPPITLKQLTSLPKLIWEEGRVAALSHTYAVKSPLDFVTMARPKFAPKSTPSRGPIPKPHHLPHPCARPTYDAKRHPDPIRRFVTMHWTRPTDARTYVRTYGPTDRQIVHGKFELFDDYRPLRYESDAA